MNQPTSGKLFENALTEIEGPVFQAFDTANALEAFTSMTIVETDYKITEQHREVFIHLIGQVFEANKKLTELWADGFNAAVLKQNKEAMRA